VPRIDATTAAPGRAGSRRPRRGRLTLARLPAARERDERVKVAYLTSYYPAVSHTFVRREVVALREQGVDVATFSIQGPHGVDVLGPADLAEARTTRPILGRRRVAIAYDLVRAVAARPRAVTAVALRAVRSVRGTRRRLWQLFYAAEAAILQRWVAAWGATHVHAHFGNASADVARWTAAIANHGGRRWTWSFTMHGPTELYSVEEHAIPAKVADADFVACISDFCRSQLMVFSDPANWTKLSIVHCGVLPEEFPEAQGSDDGVLDILCVGRLVPEKGQMVLLHAMERLAERGVPARVVFVGDGSSRATLEAEAARLGIDATFTGSVGVDVVRRLLLEADAFCLPSFAEGVPVVLMEAMASALPVVTTRIAGIPELVDDGVSGYVLAPGRDDFLADALADLARNPHRARAMGRAGRDKVRAEFDVRTSAAELKRVFVAIERGSWPAGTEAAASAPSAP
jgi:glycosyltransferase involved in cell wall biosynthesis